MVYQRGSSGNKKINHLFKVGTSRRSTANTVQAAAGAPQHCSGMRRAACCGHSCRTSLLHGLSHHLPGLPVRCLPVQGTPSPGSRDALSSNSSRPPQASDMRDAPWSPATALAPLPAARAWCTSLTASRHLTPPHTTSRHLRTALQADFFGERALLCDEPRMATVEALTDLTCLVLERDTFIQVLGPWEQVLAREKSPQVGRWRRSCVVVIVAVAGAVLSALGRSWS